MSDNIALAGIAAHLGKEGEGWILFLASCHSTPARGPGSEPLGGWDGLPGRLRGFFGPQRPELAGFLPTRPLRVF